jgi:hypothetical protein
MKTKNINAKSQIWLSNKLKLIVYLNATFHTLTVRCKLKKKPTAQIAHLVFANAQSQRTKNQKSNFLPTLEE